MSKPSVPWFGEVIWELIKRQPLRYAIAQILWISIWSMQILVGIIIAWYFDALTAGISTSQLGLVVGAMFAYAAGRSVFIFLGMRNHGSLLFRAGALMRRNLLGRIYELPGAAALDEIGGLSLHRISGAVGDVSSNQDGLGFGSGDERASCQQAGRGRCVAGDRTQII